MSDVLGLTPDEAISQISQLQIENLIFAVALSLAVYDAILSFPKEVRYIWQRSFGTGTILYLFIRYCTILNILFALLSNLPTYKTVTR
ncbi:hypothetical protein QCA50_008267 [Cerrena zonata]|uniref:DUF6533 domain-containing protein n=1 Tax=Cerrena zonata TaxID=2478898 RepID=A0AAW0GF43_9APHY